MTDLTTSTSGSPAQQTGMLPAIGTGFQRAGYFYRQPGVQRALPSIAAAIVAIIGIVLYAALQSPERTTLFSSLSEGEKSRVFDALKNGGVDVKIDSVTF